MKYVDDAYSIAVLLLIVTVIAVTVKVFLLPKKPS